MNETKRQDRKQAVDIFPTYLLLLTRSSSPLLSQSVLGSGQHTAASSANTGTVSTFTVTVFIIIVIILSLSTSYPHPFLPSWLQVDWACIVLSAHQHSISPQGHHQTVEMLQEGAWESHSETQHFLGTARQHWQPSRQNHILSYYHTICIFHMNSTRNKREGNMCQQNGNCFLGPLSSFIKKI